MKKYISLGMLLIMFNILVRAEHYYYYHGEKIPLVVSLDSITIYTKPSNVPINSALDSIVGYTIPIGNLEQTINPENMDLLSAEYMVGDSIATEKMSNSFYIKLHDVADTTLLQELVEETNTYLIGQVPCAHKWYKIMVANSTMNNSLETSNYFYETGLFADVDPGFIFHFESNSVNNTQYNSQWALSAINAYDAWNYTKGDPNVTVAVIDCDLEMEHPAFSNTNFVHPYDCSTEHSDIGAYGNHGTKVAGIIAANPNDSIMAGIAPNVSIMPIVYTNTLIKNYKSHSEMIASGIFWAVDHGADVLNCSWGERRITKGRLRSALLEDAIQYALFEGRNGKGCIVVFAGGNGETSLLSSSKAICYPAYLYSELLVVGAVDKFNYNGDYSVGKELDLVAPGIDIMTTNYKEYAREHGQPMATDYTYSSGTSYAAPYVSGIAALILSVNPNLQREEVVSIIERTARNEVFGQNYIFNNESNRSYGPWCEQVGYGLVDAHAAVEYAANMYIQNKIYSVPDGPVVERAHTIYAGYAVTDSKAYGNVSLRISTEVSYLATNKVVLKSGFHAHAGSNLHVKIVDYLSAPITTTISSPQGIAPRSSSAPADNTEQTDEVATSNSLEIIESTMIQSTAIYTISGQLLQTIDGGQRDAAHLPNGMYILQHHMSDGSTRIEKIANNK